MHVEEVVHNEPVGSPIVSNQVSNKSINNSSNNIVLFGASILKRINVKNLKSGLYNGNCRCRFFGGATSKHFHHYIPPTLNETDVITDVVVVLHMWTKEIINLVSILLENVLLLVLKVYFISSLTLNTRHKWAFKSALNKTLPLAHFLFY